MLDRDWLFGLLALRANLIDGARLADAWLAAPPGRGTPLGEWLVQERVIRPEDRAAIELMVEWQAKKGPGDAGAEREDTSDEEVQRVLAGLHDDFSGTEVPTTWATSADVRPAEDSGEGSEARGRYPLTRLYARGGIGQVWIARDEDLGRDVALKELRTDRADDPSAWSRFLEEARITGKLEHPGIVPIYELAWEAGDKPPFYTMRFINGRTLTEATRSYHKASALGRSGPLDLLVLLEAFVAVCNAVDYAHSRDVVHRDLKGQNIVLGDFGEVVVLDWGLAKTLDTPEAGSETTSVAFDPSRPWDSTQPGQVLGTPAYMAPEQAGGRTERIDRCTDVYGLGAILYEVLTDRPPFSGPDTAEVLRRVLEEPPQPPRRANAAAPPALEAVCLRALAKRPEERYASAAELASEVRRFLADEPVEAYHEPWGPRLMRWARRHRTWALAAAAALLTVTLISLAAALVVEGARRRENAAGELERVARRKAERLYAGEVMSRGLALCESGEVGQGMLWLAQSLESATQAGAEDLRAAIRANLAGWRHQFNSLVAVFPHGGRVRAVAFSPDGKLLLTGGMDGTVQLRDAAGGRHVGPSFRLGSPVLAATFSPDGKTVAAGGGDETGEGLARLWEVATGRPLGPPLPHPTRVTAVAFSPDGKLLLTGSGDRVGGAAQLWDVASQKPLGKPFPHPRAVRGVAFRHDGKAFLTGCMDRVARIWDIETRTHRGLSHASSVFAVTFSPDGKTVLTGSGDRKAYFWNAGTGKPLGLPFEHDGAVTAVAFSPDGRYFMTGGKDQTARLYNTETRQQVGQPLPHRDAVRAVTIGPGARTIATGSWDGTVRVWQTPLHEPGLHRFITYGGAVRFCAFSPRAGHVFAIAGYEESSVLLGDTATGKELHKLRGHTDSITALAFSPDGEALLTGSGDRTARLWSVATGRPLGPPLPHPSRIRAVTFSPEGKLLLVAGKDGTVLLWDRATGTKVREFPKLPSELGFAVFTRDGRAILAAGHSAKEVHQFATSTGKELRRLKGHAEGISALALSPDGTILATGSDDQTARLWLVATGEPLGPPLMHRGTVTALAFSPDGTALATGSGDKTARLWEVATGRPLGPPLPHADPVEAVAFAPSGRIVLTGTRRFWIRGGEGRLWDVVTGKPLGPAFRHKDSVHAVAFSPDGTAALIGSTSSARLWYPTTFLRGSEGTADQFLSWARVATGMDLDPDGIVRALDARGWLEHRRRLEHLVGPRF